MPLSTEEIRAQFPSLQRQHKGRDLVYLDGPGGTQVPQCVLDAMNAYYGGSNTNTHGAFITSQETDHLLRESRSIMATFLGAEGGDTISIGQNMTTLNYALARGMGRLLQPGDEILITQLDHEGNRGPWLSLREQGILVREVALLPSGALDYDDFTSKINERTRLVAMGMASNALGTLNDVEWARKITYQYNAWLLLDAVHYAPHYTIDVQKIGCDFLLCSSYKFYGPHLGFLYAKPGLLNTIPTDRLRTADQQAPYAIETGTLNHAAIAGAGRAVKFIAEQGAGDTLRQQIVSAHVEIGHHEQALAQRLYQGLASIPGIQHVGLELSTGRRAPTLSFTADGRTPWEVCEQLGTHGICAWDGHFYAIRTMEVLGLLEQGGVTRMGIAIYNTPEEIDYVLERVEEIISKG